MKKIIKIILIILIIYFAIGLIFWIYFSFSRADEIYIQQVGFYQRDKLCYECFTGTKEGNCPRINEASSRKTYPKATEDIKNEYSGEFQCYWDYDDGFNFEVPEKSLLYSFKQNWGYAWKGYFLLTFMILTLGTVRIG